MISDFEARFFGRVNKTPECWLWTGKTDRDGYGHCWDSRHQKTSRAHIVSFELSGRRVPEGLQLDHLCRVRHCVRPDHLEPVTTRENLMRGQTEARRNAEKTLCKRGHPLPFTGARRFCRECVRLRTSSPDEAREIRGQRGEEHHAAKLSESAVRSIRADYEAGRGSQYALARQYGVTRALIGMIVRRQIWIHV